VSTRTLSRQRSASNALRRWRDSAASPRPTITPPLHLANKILAAKAAMEGERKQVTVLFADVKGSMEFVVGRDPEDAQSLLDPVIERMIEADG
jgi:class 3 adenylate cyclase